MDIRPMLAVFGAALVLLGLLMSFQMSGNEAYFGMVPALTGGGLIGSFIYSVTR